VSKIRIFLIEDNRLLREGVAAMISKQADMKVVGALKGTEDILRSVGTAKPHVVLIDVGLENQNSLQIAGSLMKQTPELKVIGMGLIPSQSDIVEFVEAGASGFILKDAAVDVFLATIRSVASGGKALPSILTNSLFSHVVQYATKKGTRFLTKTVRLTTREREIIALIAEGLSNKDIASRLNISSYTVKSHVHNILEKLALQSRLQIAKKSRDGIPIWWSVAFLFQRFHELV